MSRKNNLLSIGDIAKFTGAGIRALHYYERIKILEPSYIDPDTAYRYYSFDQIYFIEVIMLCLELAIPLKELSRFILRDKTIDYAALLAYGRGIAESKIRSLNKGLEFIIEAEKNLEIMENYQKNPRVYTRKVPEKHFHAVPYEQSFDDANPQEIDKAFISLFSAEYSEGKSAELLEYGFLCEHSQSGTKRHIFVELPKHKLSRGNAIIPGGIYHCVQSRESQIERVGEIFCEHLKGSNSFWAIEIGLIADKCDLSKPMRELRVAART